MQRRTLLRAGLAWGGAAALAGPRGLVESLLAQPCGAAPAGELIATLLPHGDTARTTPFGRMVGGQGLDARRFTDLSRLQPDRLITPTSEMFVRTSAPAPVEPPRRGRLDVAALRRQARPMGAHLIECSGNTDPDNFGLMSVAEWEGVPLPEVLESSKLDGDTVLVSGRDPLLPSRSSTPGASWIFTREALVRTGAFLATGMNGQSLPPDHGAPLRLVVPGWYGCSWIKWVDDLRVVPDDTPPTSQMVEFSLRTHQRVVPRRAVDYEPPVIDVAAMPIRVEKRRLAGRLEYRVAGIVWGGDRPVDRLAIRFRAGDTPEPFPVCPAPRTHRVWSLWDYRWHPAEPGVYSIALSVVDPTIRTRRLDVSFYVRRVVIDEV